MYFSARYLCSQSTNRLQKYFRKGMIFLSSDLREGIDHSHPKTVQKMENNNCTYTEENQHVFQGREQSYFITEGRVITQSPHISRARDLCNVPHQMETPSLWTFALLPDQTFLLHLKPFVPSVSFVLLRRHRGDTEKNQQGMSVFMKLESDDASRTSM